MRLQVRDLAILEDLVLRRAETLDGLHARHFPGLSRKRAVNRLAQLARAGYLSPADVVLHDQDTTTRTYTLGPKARPALERRSLAAEHFRFRRWNPTLRDASVPHQIAVNHITDHLNATVIPEHLLPVTGKDSARHRPDAVVEGVDRDGQRMLLGIEVDLGHYSRERIAGKAAAWKTYKDGLHLVFLAPDQARIDRIKQWVPDARAFTFQSWSRFVDRARDGLGEGILLDLDIWTDGAAWQPLHERWARQDEEDRLADERRQRHREEDERRRAEAERQQALADPAHRAAAPPRSRWGRFGG